MEVRGRSLIVEMAKSLHLKKPTLVAVATTNSAQHLPLPLMMQQAVAMQQLQFQQALVMQQSLASQQAASRAASMKSATEMASARAAEISKRLKGDGDGIDDKTANRKSSSPTRPCAKSRSKSRSPIRYRRDRHSRSRSPVIFYQRDRCFRSPVRPRHHDRSCSREQIHHYRGGQDNYRKYHGRRGWGRPRDQYSGNVWRRSRSRSKTRKSPRTHTISPRHYKEKKSSPKLPKEEHKSAHRSRRSRSFSKEPRQDVKDNENISKHGAYSGKPEIEVEMCMEKLTDLHQDLEVKLIKDLIKPESCKKTLTNPVEGMSKNNIKYRDGRKKSSLEDNDNCTNNVRVRTKSDGVLKDRNSDYNSEEDTKEKQRDRKKSMMNDDEDITKRKLHRKEKRMYVDDYELDENESQKRERKAPPKLPKEDYKSAHRSRRSRSFSKEPRQDVKDNEHISKQQTAYSGKPENEVEMCMKKSIDLHQDLEATVIKDLIKPQSCKKTTKPLEGMSKDNAKYRDGRKKSRLEDNDNCTNNARVCTKSNYTLNDRKSAYDSEEDTKEKEKLSKESMMDDDEDITKRKLNRKEKRTYVDDYELEENELQKREKKEVDDNEGSEKMKHQRKGNVTEPEVHDASKQYKKHSKKDEDENIDKEMKKNQHRQRSASDLPEDTLLEYLDRADSFWEKNSSWSNRKY